MGTTLTVKFFKYNASSRYLKIFYTDGTAYLYHPVPECIYNNMMRCTNKAAFVQKYLEYDLHFTHISIQ